MYHGQFLHTTDEAFVLSSLKEFVKLWGSGSQASFQLECEEGKACLKFSCQLGAPVDRHFVPHVPQDHPHGNHGIGHSLPPHPRKKGPSQKKRDRARAEAHRARQSTIAASAVDSETSTSRASNASVQADTIYPSQLGPSAPLAASADRTATKPPTAVPAVQLDKTRAVHDEICSDTVYNNEVVDSTGKIAFRCHQCRMLYLPVSYKDGNKIEDYEICRSHIGVTKCENCARVLVGLTKIRCHRQVCPLSA